MINWEDVLRFILGVYLGWAICDLVHELKKEENNA